MTDVDPDSLPTSERLRQTQQALDASQADLSRVELELTKARMANEALHAAAGQVAADLTRVTAERDQFRSNYLRDAARVDQLDGDLVDMELNLADARAHLTRAERERDDAVRRAADLEQVREELRRSRLLVDGYHADYQQWSGEKQELIDRSLMQKAELASATAELEQLRAARTWQIARNDDTPCAACRRQIRRCEGFEPMPGAKGFFQHVLCPDPEPTKES